MKASEVVAALQDSIAKIGDRDVEVCNWAGDLTDVEGVRTRVVVRGLSYHDERIVVTADVDHFDDDRP